MIVVAHMCCYVVYVFEYNPIFNTAGLTVAKRLRYDEALMINLLQIYG